MAVGASKPTVIADADGFFSVKSKMLVSLIFKCMLCFHNVFICWKTIQLFNSDSSVFSSTFHSETLIRCIHYITSTN